MIDEHDYILNHDHPTNIFSLILTLESHVVMRDVRFSPRCSWPPRSPGVLYSTIWYLVTDIPGQLIGSIVNGQVRKHDPWRSYRQVVPQSLNQYHNNLHRNTEGPRPQRVSSEHNKTTLITALFYLILLSLWQKLYQYELRYLGLTYFIISRGLNKKIWFQMTFNF